MLASIPRIKIPMINGSDSAEFFPDELPADANDLIDVLRSELAPFRVWRACAVEYRRQGMEQAFDLVLNEIVAALEDSNVDKIFREREDYAEGLTEIYVALAAKAMSDLTSQRSTRNKLSPEEDAQQAKKVVESLKQADEKLRINEYTWLIKGFFELMVQSDIKRAEDHFKAVHDRATKGQNQLKKKFLFGSLLGLGMVAYSRQKYQIALDHFSKAIMANPGCGGTVRMAVVCCCFKLEQYDRAKLAVDMAIAMEPTNANIIVAKALLEVVTSAKQQAKEKGADQARKQCYDYCRMALALDSNNALALNLLANHYFHNWTSFSFGEGCCFLLESQHLLLPKKAVAEMRAGDKLLINSGRGSGGVWSIVGFIQDSNLLPFKEVILSLCSPLQQQQPHRLEWTDFIVVQVAAPTEGATASKDGVVKVETVQWKELNKVVELAKITLSRCNLSAVRAESHYILGKVHHSKGELNEAFDCYWRALKESPELSLAAFGAAQIYFSRSEFAAAQELFEKVLAKSPDDKDTQAYVMLLKAMNKSISTPFEKLREVAPGFKFEIDLWLLQGQLRQKVFAEYPVALKCYQHALECIEQQYGVSKVPPVLYSNIAVLLHSLGKPQKALESCKRALVAFSIHQSNSSNASSSRHDMESGLIYNNAEFEGIFYQWSEQPLCKVQLSAEAGDSFEVVTSDESTAVVDLSQHFAVGDEVVIGDVKHTVRGVTATSLVGYSPVKLSVLHSIATAASPVTFPLLVKKLFLNFNEATVTLCYNFARVLEDCGRTKAASEVYVELLKRHPSFMECYLRQSLISSDAGKTSEATTWLTRALEVSNDQPDATICLGDLYLKSDHAADAKKCYDKICVSSRHDARSMLSLGNYYYSGGSKDSRLKDSYKFFYHVLNEDAANIYAANGLAMVCAEKGELDAAKDIFAKAREANKSDDIAINLANVFMFQNRIVDAERLYQSTYNNLLRCSNESVSSRSASLSECVSFAQLKQGRFEDALKSIQKAIRMQPTDLKLWYNLAVVSKQSAAAVSKKTTKTSAEIEEAKHDLVQAVTVLEFVHRALVAKGKLSKILSVDTVQTHLRYCREKFALLESQLEFTLVGETKRREERQKLQHEHESRLRVKLEEKELQERAVETEKREKQLLAAQKSQKLAELQEKWVVATEATQSKKRDPGAAGAGGGKRKRKDKSEEDEILAGLEDSDDDGDIRPILQQKQQQPRSASKAASQSSAAKKVVYATAAEGEVDFGSSSDEEGGAGPKAGKTQLDIDLFGDDDSDEEAEGAKKRKRLSKNTGGAGGDGNESDDFAEEAVAVGTSSSSKKMTIDSDEE